MSGVSRFLSRREKKHHHSHKDQQHDPEKVCIPCSADAPPCADGGAKSPRPVTPMLPAIRRCLSSVRRSAEQACLRPASSAPSLMEGQGVAVLAGDLRRGPSLLLISLLYFVQLTIKTIANVLRRSRPASPITSAVYSPSTKPIARSSIRKTRRRSRLYSHDYTATASRISSNPTSSMHCGHSHRKATRKPRTGS